MVKESKIYKYALIIGFSLLPLTVFGQDLGSSSGIFNNPKTKTTPKKTAPKPKTPTTSRKTSPRTKPAAVKTARTRTPKPKLQPKQTQIADNANTKLPPPTTQTNLIITVGDKSSGDFDEFFERAIDEGNAARDERQYTKAEAAYLRAQSLKSKDSRAIYGLGNLYSDQQRWEEAERAYRAAIEIEPNAPEAHIALSFVLTQPILGGDLSDRYTQAENSRPTRD